MNLSALWLGCLSLLLAGSALAQKSRKTNDYYLLVGTYTTGKSEGIYVYKFNNKTGQFSAVSTATGLKNPSFLTVSPDQKFVYSVGETDGGGSVHAFSFDKKTGNLAKLNTQSSQGAGPCYVTVDKTGKWVMVGNYGGGSLTVLPVEKDGSLGKPTQNIKHEGSSVNAQRQAAPHVHSVNISANNRDVFVPDLGVDQVVGYRLDDQTGQLTPGTPTNVTKGSGPRHFAFHPNGKFAYVIQELSGTVTAFDYRDGSLTALQTLPTLPGDYKGGNSCADIHVSPDGKFLYGSNRGHDSIVIYAIDKKTGKLTLAGHQSVLGKTPRNFAIDPSGAFVLAANQASDNITIFRRNAKTGLLQPTGQEIKVPNPVCLKFVPVD
ncbi:MAG: lactonase family protein [Cytophagaceae bacterium]|nr:lactonase family protein [Cytophagaceae bacterium]